MRIHILQPLELVFICKIIWTWPGFMYTPECTHIIYNSLVSYKSILRHLNVCELNIYYLVDSCIYFLTMQEKGGVGGKDACVRNED